MQLIGVHSWTGTNGAGTDFIRKVFVLKTKLDGVDSLFEYKKLNAQNHKRAGVIERLETLKDSLYREYGSDIDPVKYLGHLYYDEGFSIKDIRAKLEKYGVVYADESSVRRLFEDHFGWEIREKSGAGSRLAKKRRQVVYKNNDALQEGVEVWRSLVEEAVQNKVAQLMGTIEQIEPLGEVPEVPKIEKVAFILHSQGLIEGPTSESLAKLAVSLKGELGSVRQVMSTISEVVKIISPKHPIEIDPSNFYKLFGSKKEAV